MISVLCHVANFKVPMQDSIFFVTNFCHVSINAENSMYDMMNSIIQSCGQYKSHVMQYC